ncbi:MAG: hypothetical protein IPP48_02945 [Chitinophagaceae bacterium]|nr:hypothetical protein [Chitinophagaceae bacterium]
MGSNVEDRSDSGVALFCLSMKMPVLFTIDTNGEISFVLIVALSEMV